MGACHIALGAACLGIFPGVGTFYLTRQTATCTWALTREWVLYTGYYSNINYTMYNVFIVYTIITIMHQVGISGYCEDID